MKKYIGIDLGGTYIKIGIVDETGRLLHHQSVDTEANEGKKRVIDNICEGVQRCVTGSGLKWNDIERIGVGAAGFVDIRRGVVLEAPNLPDWKNVPLHDILTKRLQKPVIIENDANAAALGEWWIGAGKDVEHLICLTLGTGVGGGLILNNRIYHGAIGIGGELGHITVDPNSSYIKNGIRGSLEALASGSAIIKFAKKNKKDNTLLNRIIQENHHQITPHLVYQAAKEGDPTAVQIYYDVGRYLGIGVASLIHIFNPQMVVLTGGVASGFDLMEDSFNQMLAERVFAPFRNEVVIVVSELKRSGVIGAAAVARFEE